MVEIQVELIKMDLEEALSEPQLNFKQAHYILRQAIEKLLLCDKKYNDVIQRYHMKDKDINGRLLKASEEYNMVLKEQAENDKSMYEAIKNL